MPCVHVCACVYVIFCRGGPRMERGNLLQRDYLAIVSNIPCEQADHGISSVYDMPRLYSSLVPMEVHVGKTYTTSQYSACKVAS